MPTSPRCTECGAFAGEMHYDTCSRSKGDSCLNGVYQLRDEEVVDDFISSVKKLGEAYATVQPPSTSAPTPHHWQLVDLARDMCRAAGYDPDQRVLDTQNAQRGPLGSTLVSATVPAWTLYLNAAENVKDALNG